MTYFHFMFHDQDKCRKYKIATAVLAILIFILSIQESAGPVISFPFIDKFLHMIAYFSLCLLACKSFEKRENFFKLAFIFAFSYGIAMESFQLFMPLRNFEILDIIANGFGAGLVYLAIIFDLNVFNREKGYLRSLIQ